MRKYSLYGFCRSFLYLASNWPGVLQLIRSKCVIISVIRWIRCVCEAMWEKFNWSISLTHSKSVEEGKRARFFSLLKPYWTEIGRDTSSTTVGYVVLLRFQANWESWFKVRAFPIRIVPLQSFVFVFIVSHRIRPFRILLLRLRSMR